MKVLTHELTFYSIKFCETSRVAFSADQHLRAFFSALLLPASSECFIQLNQGQQFIKSSLHEA